MKIEPIFAWYDLWVGFYWDRKARKLYILPLPMLGVVLSFRSAVTPVAEHSVELSLPQVLDELEAAQKRFIYLANLAHTLSERD